MKNRWESSNFKKSYIANSISDYYIYYVEGMFSFIINSYIFSKLIFLSISIEAEKMAEWHLAT